MDTALLTTNSTNTMKHYSTDEMYSTEGIYSTEGMYSTEGIYSTLSPEIRTVHDRTST